MKLLRNTVIRAGLEALYFSGAHYLLRPIFAGVGVIFMLHHVRPRRDGAFQPNHHLEVEPEFLRAVPTEHDMQREISALCTRHGVDETPIARELCMSWDELKAFADDPLVTIGAHTITHCNLARQSEETASFELATSRARIEAALQRPVLHLAYPYGDRIAAGQREFALAKAAGFKTAVTTRPGMIFPESAEHMTALQRVSLNGNYQDARILPVLTSGAATAMWNGCRRVDAA